MLSTEAQRTKAQEILDTLDKEFVLLPGSYSVVLEEDETFFIIFVVALFGDDDWAEYSYEADDEESFILEDMRLCLQARNFPTR